MSLDFSKAFQLAEAKITDQKEESLKRQVQMFKQHLDRINTNLKAHQDRKKEDAMAKLFKEDVEQLDELSKATLQNYKKKAEDSASHHAFRRTKDGKAITSVYDYEAHDRYTPEDEKRERTSVRRENGAHLAKLKIADKEKSEHPIRNAIKNTWNKIRNKHEVPRQKFKYNYQVEEVSQENIMERNDKVLGRYRIVHNQTGEVMGSHDDRSEALALGKKCGGFPHVRMEDSEKAA